MSRKSSPGLQSGGGLDQLRMHDFLKEGSGTKFLKPCPLSIETSPIFSIVLERNLLPYLSIKISAKACKGEPQQQFS